MCSSDLIQTERGAIKWTGLDDIYIYIYMKRFAQNSSFYFPG